MIEHIFKHYAVVWFYFIISRFSQYSTSKAILSYMTHMTPWNLLLSKFLEGHPSLAQTLLNGYEILKVW